MGLRARDRGAIERARGGRPCSARARGERCAICAGSPTTWRPSTSTSRAPSTSRRASSRSSPVRESWGPRLFHGQLRCASPSACPSWSRRSPAARSASGSSARASRHPPRRLRSPRHATFHPALRKHVLCIAGGSGIAGMMSVLSHACAADTSATGTGTCYFGVRTARDGFFPRRVGGLRARYPDRLAVTVSPLRRGGSRRTGRRLSSVRLRARLRARGGRREDEEPVHGRPGVRAGPPPMVDASLRLLLREARLAPSDIRYDKFS